MKLPEYSAKQEPAERISLRDLLLKMRKWRSYFASKWKILLLAFTIGSALGVTYAIIKKPVYTATCTFVLENANSGGQLAQYAGLASMMGVNIGGSGNGIFQSDNIIELYLSKKMVQKTLLTPLNDSIDNQPLIIDRYIEFNKLKDEWKDKPELRDIGFKLAPRHKFSRIQDSLLAVIFSDIKKKYLTVTKYNDNVNMIKVEVKATDELFAKAFNDNIVKNVNDFYIQTKTKIEYQNVQILQHQTDSVRNVINGAINASAATVDATPNLNPNRQILRVPSQRSQVSAEANKAILGELVKNLELAKMSFRKETPLLEVVDRPVFPLEKTKLSIAKAFITAALLVTILTILVLFIRKKLQEILE